MVPQWNAIKRGWTTEQVLDAARQLTPQQRDGVKSWVKCLKVMMLLTLWGVQVVVERQQDGLVSCGAVWAVPQR
jgi:hypothetical protein